MFSKHRTEDPSRDAPGLATVRRLLDSSALLMREYPGLPFSGFTAVTTN
jgi:hypothetical protein